MTRTALVTGGTGYIASELIAQLLERGWNVHTTIRSRTREEALRQRLRDPDPVRLKVFVADLMDDEGWAAANAGCTAVAHVASPFPLGVPKDADTLVVPAREGTLRALRFAKEAGVRRFVQTSSSAAIAYGHKDKTQFDESDWSDLDSDLPPYVRSKTVAERAARDWVEENAPEMEYCSVNPVAVFGPVRDGDLSTSVEMVKRLSSGAIPMIPNMGISVVDVRDVARIHVAALEAPAETIRGERFAASEGFMWIEEMAEAVRQRAPELSGKVPRRRMPDFLVKLLAPFMPEMKMIRNDLGRKSVVSGKHASEVLGIEYIPAAQSVADTVRSLAAHGLLKS